MVTRAPSGDTRCYTIWRQTNTKEMQRWQAIPRDLVFPLTVLTHKFTEEHNKMLIHVPNSTKVSTPPPYPLDKKPPCRISGSMMSYNCFPYHFATQLKGHVGGFT